MKSLPPIQIGKIGKMGIKNTRFSILNLSPALWLDAADLSTITESGGAVSQWDDKSGNGYHAVQATGSEQPVTGTRTLNGRNVLDFDGTNDNMDIDYAGLFSVPSGNNTVIIVWKTDVSGTEQRTFSGFVGGGTRWGVQYRIAGSNRLNGVNNTGFSPTNHTITEDTNAHIDFMRRSASDVETGRDGSSTTAANGANVTVDNIRLGATLGATSSVNGVIAEALLFNRALSNTEINWIGNYLATKWSISWTNI